jgi:predicted nuclease of predicted toxin-antitoxin system
VTAEDVVPWRRLYFDHNVARRLAQVIRARGYDVVEARALGLARAPDGEQLLEATRQRRVLVTHDAEDFALLHDACGAGSRRFRRPSCRNREGGW